MKATTPTPVVETSNKKTLIRQYAQSTIKVALALAFVVAALNLGGYLQLSALAKEILAVINGLTGVWILISNVR